MIPYGRQSISEADIEAVTSVLRSDFLTQGPGVPIFEQALSDYTGCPQAVAVNSGTSALHIACLALGVGAGDSVWTSPLTFVASANCARYCGASVDFVDIEPESGNLCVQSLQRKLEQAEKDNALPKVVIPVHYSGASCEMQAIGELASRYGFRVIEDASHAVGATYAGKPVGCCAFSDITVFSFHPVKIITSAEGGAALTRCEKLAKTLRELRTHGITKDPEHLMHPAHGAWYYEQQSLGFNYRMTDLQAALASSQMKRLKSFVKKRLALAQRYDERLASLPLKRPPLNSESSWHLYPVRFKDAATRRQVFDGLRAADIGVQVHYIPVYQQPDYAQFGFAPESFPNTETYYAGEISLPLYPELSEKEQDYVIETLTQLLNA